MAVEVRGGTDLAGFWDGFLANYWEKQPMVLPDPPVTVRMDPDELFEGIARGVRNRGKKRAPGFRFWLDNGSLSADVGRFLPSPEDGSWDGYFGRLEDQIGDREWSLQVNRLHLIDYDLWASARTFLSGFFEARGDIPAGYVDFDLFAGKYRSTPIGIHVDYIANFMFTPVGRKLMLAWPHESGPHLPKLTLDYDSVRDEAIRLEGDAETLIYFPSDYFHVGESPDEPTVSTNIAIFDPNPAGLVNQTVLKAAAKRLERARQEAGPQADAVGEEAMAAGQRQAMEALREAAADPAVEEELADARLRHLTGSGFDVVAAPAEVDPPADGDVIQRSASFPILTHSGAELTVSANGHSARLPVSDDRLQGVLDALNRDEALTVAQLIERCSRSTPPGDDIPADDLTRALVYRLDSWRAIERVHS